MNIDFLVPYIILCISISWANGSKAVSESRFDLEGYYSTPIWNTSFSMMILSVFIAIIVIWVKYSFWEALTYLFIAIGAFFIASATIGIILIKIFGFRRLGSILPILTGIGSILWLFTII